MGQISKKSLDEMVAGKDLTSLIGCSENQYFDCKSQLYDFSKDHNKRKLAKDVSSFANTSGGYIFVGVETNENDIQVGGVVLGIGNLKESHLDPRQVVDLCDEWIYPRVDGLDCIWIPNSADDSGVYVITIPEQDVKNKPYLITKSVDSNSRISEVLFGYAERIRDSSKPLRVNDVHSILKNGLSYESNINSGFELLKSKLESLKDSVEVKFEFDQATRRAEEVEETIGESLANDVTGNSPYFFLAASKSKPYSATEFQAIVDSSDDLLKVASTPLRDGGWKLQNADDEIVHGSESVSIEGFSRRLRVHRNGIITYSARLAEITHLNRDVIIPIALAEVAFVFAVILEKFLGSESEKEKSTEATVEVRLGNLEDLEGNSVVALPYNMGANMFFPPQPSPSREFKDRLLLGDVLDAKQSAFLILNSIYKFYGFSDDPPFTERLTGVGMVQFD